MRRLGIIVGLLGGACVAYGLLGVGLIVAWLVENRSWWTPEVWITFRPWPFLSAEEWSLHLGRCAAYWGTLIGGGCALIATGWFAGAFCRED